MPVMQGLEWTFDTVAAAYGKLRPGYVKELYEALLDYVPLSESSRVVEVGSGGGQATAPILTTGCRLTAVEYGERFSALLKEKFREYPNFSVVTGKFEDTPFEDGVYDLVFSASAFHWVPEKIGYEKVFAMLKSGGAFARFANHPYRCKGNPALGREIDGIYDRYYNKYYHKGHETISEYTEREARDRAWIAAKYGFSDIRYKLFYRDRVFSAKEYIALLGTYSDHIAIEENYRAEFFAKIEEAIHSHGDTITVHDTIELQLARKP